MAESSPAQPGRISGSGSANLLAEYRLGPEYRRPYLARFILFGVLTVLLAALWTQGHSSLWLVLDSFIGPVATYYGVVYLWRDRFRTRLTTQGIEIRGYFNHFVPWREVKAITEDGYGSSQPLDADYDIRLVSPRGAPYRRSGGRAGATMGRRAKLGVVRVVRFRGKSMMVRAPLVTSWAPDPYFEQKLRHLQDLSRQYGTRPADPGGR
jgi:hypothetical protein